MLLALGRWYEWGGLFALLWFFCLVSVGVLSWKHGHKVMFFIGFVFPVLWFVGAIWDPPPKYQPGSRY